MPITPNNIRAKAVGTIGSIKPQSATWKGLVYNQQVAVTSIHISNVAATHDAFHVKIDNPKTDNTAPYLYYNVVLPPRDTLYVPGDILINQNERMMVYSVSGNIAFNAYGFTFVIE